jgi:hypothetical protein
MTLKEIKKQVQQEGIVLQNEIGSYIRVVSPSQSEIIITEKKGCYQKSGICGRYAYLVF